MANQIQSKADYEQALKRIDELMQAEPGTSEGNELDFLATLVEEYEAYHYAVDSPKQHCR